MSLLSELYGHSLALLTDLYQLTMAHACWKSGLAEREAVFHLFFRKHPFEGGFTVACGLEHAVAYMQELRFGEADRAYLESLAGADGKPLFDRGFLEWLGRLAFSCDVDAVPEGTVVFPQEPLVRVKGPVALCQLLETPLLNLVNFQTPIATKAARICLAARGQPVLEFGLRRAQGIDGALSASRAAYAGGCAATSNVLAGKLFGIPVRGTHAHSWVMLFDEEKEAFRQYARAMPNNCVFLVDTYNTLDGVRRTVEVGKWLREQGQEMVGVRLDSGDLAYLSSEARKILDEAGFPEAAVLASNDLDEHTIESLKDQHAAIAVWGVGTRLVTGHDEPALGGVYKLGAVREDGVWRYRVKLSEQAAKISNPGVLQVRRFSHERGFEADAIYDEERPPAGPWAIVDPLDPTRRKQLAQGAPCEDLLVPVFRAGRLVYEPPPLSRIRERVVAQLAGLHSGVKRFLNPHSYPVGLEESLHETKTQFVMQARGSAGRQGS
ncbi:MAG: nicotinate phosphoribosyltransferase [Candidatus Wallbacteria bacterium]|nr:nicotinate phosphoribosyltransferase [Candidatus Wallbacteria bacterium]